MFLNFEEFLDILLSKGASHKRKNLKGPSKKENNEPIE